jgi:hypothetical protein
MYYLNQYFMKKGKMLSIRLSENDHIKLNNGAKALGISKTDYVKNCIYGNKKADNNTMVTAVGLGVSMLSYSYAKQWLQRKRPTLKDMKVELYSLGFGLGIGLVFTSSLIYMSK